MQAVANRHPFLDERGDCQFRSHPPSSPPHRRVHRTARADDQQLGKYNGLGGKREPLEDVAAGMRRELREEAGVEVTAMWLRGTISWPGFGAPGEDWFGFVLMTGSFVGELPMHNAEGLLFWAVSRQGSVPASLVLGAPAS